jgi:NADH dehydrogenase [ubiquinone] 1 alpha subcomplex assembly factor 1
MIFSGNLSTKFYNPEKTSSSKTGYTNMQSLTQYYSFVRLKKYDFTGYTHFLIKLRGDGRSYMFNLNTSGEESETRTYMYSYPIFTRGGPYWQTIKIPFSKFMQVSQSRLTDRQARFHPIDVKNIGITVMDTVDGDFRLEIESIAVLCDIEAFEDIAYESYKVEKFVANT